MATYSYGYAASARPGMDPSTPGYGDGSDAGGGIDSGAGTAPRTQPTSPTGASGLSSATDGQPDQTLQDTTAGRQGVAEGGWIPYQNYADAQSTQSSDLSAYAQNPSASGTAAPPTLHGAGGAPINPTYGGFAQGPGPSGYYGDQLSRYFGGG